ncbi:MAG: hypothetical protein ACTSU5_04875 [Promethearchaeota archaeon]
MIRRKMREAGCLHVEYQIPIDTSVRRVSLSPEHLARIEKHYEGRPSVEFWVQTPPVETDAGGVYQCVRFMFDKRLNPRRFSVARVVVPFGLSGGTGGEDGGQAGVTRGSRFVYDCPNCGAEHEFYLSEAQLDQVRTHYERELERNVGAIFYERIYHLVSLPCSPDRAAVDIVLDENCQVKWVQRIDLLVLTGDEAN